jgi:hypothetical protein
MPGLKKNGLKPHLKKCWRIPPKGNGAFAAATEDVLAVYARPHDENMPVVNMDEKPYQLRDDTREPLPMSGSTAQRADYEYARNGACSIFMFTEPLGGWRYARAFPRRTKKGWAYRIKWLLDEQYPQAGKAVPVADNLNTHTLPSPYETFPPEEAFRLAGRLEIHYTPKHGSWLNIAGIELSVMAAQCLGQRRIPDLRSLNEELAAWHTLRNQSQKGVDWQFTASDARIKLKRLYPVIV